MPTPDPTAPVSNQAFPTDSWGVATTNNVWFYCTFDGDNDYDIMAAAGGFDGATYVLFYANVYE